MRAAINIWTWGVENQQQFEQGIKEASDVGYRAVENLGAVLTFFEDCPEEFDAMMGRYGVDFVCAYHHLTGDWEADFDMAKRTLTFLGRHDVSLMNLQAAPRPDGGPGEKELADTVDKASLIGEFAGQHGVTVCLHPHYGTNVERADELAYLMEHVEPELLSLTLDTAHTVLGEMDPVPTFSQYASRVRYVHLKDIVPVDDPSAPWYSGFRELGRGLVNFPGVVRVLDQAGFDGVLCVELDRPRICGYKSAEISRQYLRDELGL